MIFNRTKNSTKTFISGLISKCITIICPFLIRSLIIYQLGAQYLGLTSLFTSILSILNISELGISAAVAYCLYKPIAEDNKEEINALLSLLKKLYMAIGLFILGTGLLVMPFLRYLIHGDYPNEINIHILFLIYLSNAVVSYLGFAYKTILFEAYQQGDVNHIINLIVEIIKFIFQVYIIVYLKNYYLFALMLPLSGIIVNLITESASRKLHPEVIPKGVVTKRTKNTIKKKVAFLAGHSIASKITNSIDSIVISGALGVSSIAIYGNYQYISTAVFSIVLILFQALKPAIGNTFYTDSPEKQIRTFNSLRLISLWICSFCAVCLLCLYQPFITMWIGTDYLLDFYVVAVIVMFFYANISRTFYSSIYIEALGLWDKTLARQIIAAVVNLVLDIVLVKSLGIFGIVMASFVSTAMIAYPMDVYTTYKYILRKSPVIGELRMCLDYVLVLGLCSITYFFCSFVKIAGLSGLLIKFGICLVLPNLILFVCLHKKDEFTFITSHLRHLIKL